MSVQIIETFINKTSASQYGHRYNGKQMAQYRVYLFSLLKCLVTAWFQRGVLAPGVSVLATLTRDVTVPGMQNLSQPASSETDAQGADEGGATWEAAASPADLYECRGKASNPEACLHLQRCKALSYEVLLRVLYAAGRARKDRAVHLPAPCGRESFDAPLPVTCWKNLRKQIAALLPDKEPTPVLLRLRAAAGDSDASATNLVPTFLRLYTRLSVCLLKLTAAHTAERFASGVPGSAAQLVQKPLEIHTWFWRGSYAARVAAYVCSLVNSTRRATREPPSPERWQPGSRRDVEELWSFSETEPRPSRLAQAAASRRLDAPAKRERRSEEGRGGRLSPPWKSLMQVSTAPGILDAVEGAGECVCGSVAVLASLVGGREGRSASLRREGTPAWLAKLRRRRVMLHNMFVGIRAMSSCTFYSSRREQRLHQLALKSVPWVACWEVVLVSAVLATQSSAGSCCGVCEGGSCGGLCLVRWLSTAWVEAQRAVAKAEFSFLVEGDCLLHMQNQEVPATSRLYNFSAKALDAAAGPSLSHLSSLSKHRRSGAAAVFRPLLFESRLRQEAFLSASQQIEALVAVASDFHATSASPFGSPFSNKNWLPPALLTAAGAATRRRPCCFTDRPRLNSQRAAQILSSFAERKGPSRGGELERVVKQGLKKRFLDTAERQRGRASPGVAAKTARGSLAGGAGFAVFSDKGVKGEVLRQVLVGGARCCGGEAGGEVPCECGIRPPCSPFSGLAYLPLVERPGFSVACLTLMVCALRDGGSLLSPVLGGGEVQGCLFGGGPSGSSLSEVHLRLASAFGALSAVSAECSRRGCCPWPSPTPPSDRRRRAPRRKVTFGKVAVADSAETASRGKGRGSPQQGRLPASILIKRDQQQPRDAVPGCCCQTLRRAFFSPRAAESHLRSGSFAAVQGALLLGCGAASSTHCLLVHLQRSALYCTTRLLVRPPSQAWPSVCECEERVAAFRQAAERAVGRRVLKAVMADVPSVAQEVHNALVAEAQQSEGGLGLGSLSWGASRPSTEGVATFGTSVAAWWNFLKNPRSLRISGRRSSTPVSGGSMALPDYGVPFCSPRPLVRAVVAYWSFLETALAGALHPAAPGKEIRFQIKEGGGFSSDGRAKWYGRLGRRCCALKRRRGRGKGEAFNKFAGEGGACRFLPLLTPAPALFRFLILDEIERWKVLSEVAHPSDRELAALGGAQIAALAAAASCGTGEGGVFSQRRRALLRNPKNFEWWKEHLCSRARAAAAAGAAVWMTEAGAAAAWPAGVSAQTPETEALRRFLQNAWRGAVGGDAVAAAAAGGRTVQGLLAKPAATPRGSSQSAGRVFTLDALFAGAPPSLMASFVHRFSFPAELLTAL